MSGFGTYRFADGATYEGVMRNNWADGEGTARYTNGGVYVGRWKKGKYEVRPDPAAARVAQGSCWMRFGVLRRYVVSCCKAAFLPWQRCWRHDPRGED